MNVPFPADAFDTAASVEAAGPDEFYAFEGDPEYGKPPYWVARFGTTVFSRNGDDEALEHADYHDDFDPYRGYVDDFEHIAPRGEGYARAAFAEATCDPDGPGAPQPGDLIEVYYDNSDDPEVEEVFGCEPVHTQWLDGNMYLHHFRIEVNTDIIDVEPHRCKIVYRPPVDGDERRADHR